MADDRRQRKLPVLAMGGGVSSHAELAEDWYFACTSDALGARRYVPGCECLDASVTVAIGLTLGVLLLLC